MLFLGRVIEWLGGGKKPFLVQAASSRAMTAEPDPVLTPGPAPVLTFGPASEKKTGKEQAEDGLDASASSAPSVLRVLEMRQIEADLRRHGPIIVQSREEIF